MDIINIWEMNKRFKGNLATKIDVQSKIIISDFYGTMSKFTVHITYQVVNFSGYIGHIRWLLIALIFYEIEQNTSVVLNESHSKIHHLSVFKLFFCQ